MPNHALKHHVSITTLFIVLCSVGLQQAAADEALPRIPATAPEHAAATIQLQHGFRAELIAAEPLITDPIAIQYDENGLAYVVEMNDYPYSDKSFDKAWQDQESKPLGRIRVLEDTDHDGIYDRATVFAENLSWPSGLALWKGGVYVTATPDVLYLKDTDGDHKADEQRKVFTGFRKYNVQAVMNNLQWSLDHQIYAAGSSNGGSVSKVGSTDAVTMRRSDFRFDPRTEKLELVSGGARFGHTIDDWGNRFLCDIRNPIQHVVLPSSALKRNPFLPVASLLHDVAASGDQIAVYQISPPEPWRVINAARQAADAATRPPRDSMVSKGFVTSSSGVTVYRGAAYPAEFQGNVFIGEVAGNLAMRYRLTKDGVSFAGNRAEDGVDFLASTDNWFRPVNFANAPDGMLHVLDMYRETVEHPWSMPDDLKAQVDLTSGRDRGRIYRLVPPNFAPGFQPPPAPRLGSATTEELVGELSNPNGWWRDTAHRLLFERQDKTAVPLLKSLLTQGNSPLARLHALWSLQGLDSLEAADILKALQDADGHVREHAVQLAEPLLAQNADLLNAVLGMANDTDARVRFQVALMAGNLTDDRVAAALSIVAKRDRDDPWTRLAVLSSLRKAELPFLKKVINDAEFVQQPGGRQMIEQLAFVVGAEKNAAQLKSLHSELQHMTLPDADRQIVQRQILAGLGAGLKRGGQTLEASVPAEDAGAKALVSRMITQASAEALDPNFPLPERIHAVEFLKWANFDTAASACTALLNPREPQNLQLTALDTLISFPVPGVAEKILARYSALTPDVRAEAITRLLGRSDSIVPVFDAIAAGKVSKARVAWYRRDIYMKHVNADIRERALALFAADIPGPRSEVIAEYQTALTLLADPDRGLPVFRRECLDCHKYQSEGHEVGPNLVTVLKRTKAELLLHILDPNREVSPNFAEYTIVTTSGQAFSGMIASETATTVTLRQPRAKEHIILRSDIEEFQSQQRSLMPEGLEKKLPIQDMADLLAWLTSQQHAL